MNRPGRKAGIQLGNKDERRRCGTDPLNGSLISMTPDVFSAAPSGLVLISILTPALRPGLFTAGPSDLKYAFGRERIEY